MDTLDVEDGEALTGAELFHYLTTRNEQQLAESRRKIKEYAELEDVLQNITDRCRVPILAPVASGMAYFEATMDYTNNILVLLGDSWFAERSAKQAREIAGRRLEFLRREEAILVTEGAALAQRQGLFLDEIPKAKQAMEEVEAAKADALRKLEKKAGDKVTSSSASHPEPPTEDVPALPRGLEDSDLAVIDELDELTEEELLQIEQELGEKIEDDELVERIMTEKMIEKKEKRLREALRQGQAGKTQSCTASQPSLQNEEEKESPSVLTRKPLFNVPGDIGRIAVSAVKKAATNDEESFERHVRFNDVVDVVPPPPPLPAPAPACGAEVRTNACDSRVLGEVMEHHDHRVMSGSPLPSRAAAAAASKKKSIFRSEIEKSQS